MRTRRGPWASGTQKHSEAGDGRPVDRGAWTANTVKRPRQQPAHPQYANYWAPLTRRRHIPPHSAQPGTPTTGLRERGNDTSKSTGRSGRQNAAPRRNMRRGERVTVQGGGPVPRWCVAPPAPEAPGGGVPLCCGPRWVRAEGGGRRGYRWCPPPPCPTPHAPRRGGGRPPPRDGLRWSTDAGRPGPRRSVLWAARR